MQVSAELAKMARDRQRTSSKVVEHLADPPATDARFQAAQHDPRFQRFPKAKAKVDIDERFAGMFEDRAFQARPRVDKRGRRLDRRKPKEDLRRYYRLQNEEEDWATAAALTQAGTEEQPANAAAPIRGTASGDKQKAKHSSVDSDLGKEDAPSHDRTRLRRERARDQKVRLEPKPAAEPSGHIPASSSSPDGSDGSPVVSERRPNGGGDVAAGRRWALIRGMAGPETSSSEDDSSESPSGDDTDAEPDVDLSEWGVGAMAANPDEKIPEAADETSRLAILDLDWTKVKAVDIYAMLSSFLTRGQQLKRVAVYPSDYGLLRMAEEARLGPQGLFGAATAVERSGEQAASAPAAAAARQRGGGKQGLSESERAVILETLNEQSSDGESREESDDEGSGRSGDVLQADVTHTRNYGAAVEEPSDPRDEDEAAVRLQLYERSRLRYYYAVVECSDVATAALLYRECDGMEFEHSASTFDLRYVPDSENFSGREARDTAESVPAGYKPPDVKVAAMLHTRPRLTWDADDDERRHALSRRPTRDQLRDDDFKAYLGSDSDEEADPDQSSRERYRQLLADAEGNGTAGKKDWAKPDGSDESEASGDDAAPGRTGAADPSKELQITFGGGLDALAERLKARREAGGRGGKDTLWQAYLKRRREKKLEAARRGRKVDSDADSGSDGGLERSDPYFKHDDAVFEDPFFKDAVDEPAVSAPAADKSTKAEGREARKAERQARRAAAAAEARRQAELELLMMDDAGLQDALKTGASELPEKAATEKPKGRLSRKARLAAKKAAKAARRADSDDDEAGPSAAGSGFKVDVSDPRFDALFTSAEYALDPTDSRFRAGEGATTIMREAAKRKKAPQTAGTAPRAPEGGSASGKDSVKALVAALKRKSVAPGQRKPQSSAKKAKHQGRPEGI